MNWRDWLKNRLLKRGIVISRPPGQFIIPHIKLADAKRRGLRIDFAIDGGAAEGLWARMIREIYPAAQILCIEPREDSQAQLKATARELGNIQIASTLIGGMIGEIEFFEQGDQSSILPDHDRKPTGGKKHPITTIDALLQQMNLPRPDLIKLDLQGAELAALQGAENALKNCQAVELEMSFISFGRGMPILAEMIAHMKSRGFVIYDVLGLWHRPLDGAMIQGDFLFLKEDHPLRLDQRYTGGNAR